MIRNLIQTAFWTVVILGAAALIFYNAFNYFDGWYTLFAIIGQAGVLVLVAFVVRWSRYPGIYQSKPVWRLIIEVCAATFVFTGGLLIIALLARFHILEFLNTDALGYRLGLEFKFKKGKTLRVSAAAPKEQNPGKIGVINEVRVTARDEFTTAPPEPPGVVYYRIIFPEGTYAIVPECNLVELFAPEQELLSIT